jgi:hypothetical protein
MLTLTELHTYNTLELGLEDLRISEAMVKRQIWTIDECYVYYIYDINVQ